MRGDSLQGRPVMLEFSKFYADDFAHGRDFVAALDGFLGEVPLKGWLLGIEMRNKKLADAGILCLPGATRGGACL